jgi:hypothetical protein
VYYRTDAVHIELLIIDQHLVAVLRHRALRLCRIPDPHTVRTLVQQTVYRRNPTAEMPDSHKPLYYRIDAVYDRWRSPPSLYLGQTLPDIGLDRSLSVAMCPVND